MQITHLPIDDLRPNPRNSRTHSSAQIEQVARSIRTFGFNNPVLIDSDRIILAGHGRVEAAKKLGLKSVPTVEIGHLTEAEKRAYVIADNRLAELAGWDRDTLAIELEELIACDVEFEITDTGFSIGEIDVLLTSSADTGEDDPADSLEVEEGPRVSQRGDLWLIGEHRLLCGDALDRASYEVLMDGAKAEMVFTDPPYNVPIQGHVSGLGKALHREFAMASGEMTEAQFSEFLTSAFQRLVEFSTDGSIHFVCMDWRHLLELLTVGRNTYCELKNLCVWAKSNGGMGSLYRSQHELVAVFKSGTAPHANNIELGQNGRNRTNVWHYGGMNGFQAGRDEKLAMHPTVKPVGLIADAILDCSRRRRIVLDPFVGSGTTVIAAERVGRRAYAMELDPAYCDVALRRVRKICGIEPIHRDTGKTFAAAEARANAEAGESDYAGEVQ